MALKTGRKILQAHPYGFKCFILTVDRGIGKSSYGLIVVKEVYQQMGWDSKDAWQEALRCCKFHIKEVISFLRESALADKPKPVLLWDDVGIHASGSKYFLNMKMVDHLKAVLDTIRTAISGLIMTCPTTTGLLSMLNNYDDYKLIIRYSQRGGYYRDVTAYKWNTLPSGKRIIKTQYYDYYNCYIPNNLLNKYIDMRKNALKQSLDMLEESVSK